MTPRERFLLIVPGVLFLIAFGAFELGRLASRKEAERKVTARQPSSTATSKQDDATLIRSLKAQGLDQRRFSFSAVIEGATGNKIIPFDPKNPAALLILEAIRKSADHAMQLHSQEGSDLRGLRRINEGSRFFEDTLREQIDAHPALLCSIPLTSDGREQRMGYPDLRIEHVESGLVTYLDPKLYEEGSRASTLRSFYYKLGTQPSKVSEDAQHLLLGFAHDGADGAWTFTSWDLLDLSTLTVGLKAEFQASNQDLYEGDSPLASSRPAESSPRESPR